VIGFHIFENARNLIAVCEKLLKLEISIKKGGFIVIEYNGRNILVKINHIGIDQEDMATMLRS
jgi:trehalose 6-phosphate synthase/phosphatase